MQYEKLNDASNNTEVENNSRERLAPRTNRRNCCAIWYQKEHVGTECAEPSLGTTHALLGTVVLPDADDLTICARLYCTLQGEYWSPNGEANTLIRKKGLQHTSMSVGDLIQIVRDGTSILMQCMPMGWAVGIPSSERKEMGGMVNDILAETQGPSQENPVKDTLIETSAVLDEMIRHGGGFISKLAEAWRAADSYNQSRLLRAFRNEYNQYEQDARETQRRNAKGTVSPS